MRCGCFGGNVLKLTDDMRILQPTMFPTVPRLLNRIYGKINDSFNSATGLKKWLITKAMAAKQYYLEQTGEKTHSVYDKLVFKKTKELLGGKCRVIVTGSAPISGSVLDFFKITMCCHVCEGYGLTETCGGSFITLAHDKETGSVGGPVQNVKYRLRDIPEMSYLTTDNPPRGEVCIWGPGVTPGYFLNPEKTAEAFHNDWFCTGDVGMVQDNMSLKIIDRAKNIFKLSQGEYIAPEKLENIYVKSTYILQCWMYGDSLRDYIIGLIVVDPDSSKKYAAEHKKDHATITEDTEFKQAVLDEIWKLAVENKFNSLEKPKQIALLKDPFTIESDVLTPTMKLKRNVAKKVFEDKIKELYDLPVMTATKKK